MKEIQLTQGKVAMVDDQDFELVNERKWCATKTFNGNYYAACRLKEPGRRMVRLHTFLTGFKETDHIDGDGLNNQRDNLRDGTHTENSHNSRKHAGTRVCSSKYKGVTFIKSRNNWRCGIQVNGKYIFLGHHKTETIAAQVYNIAAAKHFGEFARLNIIQAP